jgi:hypothetical protein
MVAGRHEAGYGRPERPDAHGVLDATQSKRSFLV